MAQADLQRTPVVLQAAGAIEAARRVRRFRELELQQSAQAAGIGNLSPAQLDQMKSIMTCAEAWKLAHQRVRGNFRAGSLQARAGDNFASVMGVGAWVVLPADSVARVT